MQWVVLLCVLGSVLSQSEIPAGQCGIENFYEDFSVYPDQNNFVGSPANTNGWSSVNGFQWSLTDGRLMSRTDENFGSFGLPLDAFENFVVKQFPSWDHVHVDTMWRTPDDDGQGLALRYTNPSSYYLCFISRNTYPSCPAMREEGQRFVMLKVNASGPCSDRSTYEVARWQPNNGLIYNSGQRYKLSFSMVDNKLLCTYDRNLDGVLDDQDPQLSYEDSEPLPGGETNGIGVWSFDNEGSEFSYVNVTRCESLFANQKIGSKDSGALEWVVVPIVVVVIIVALVTIAVGTVIAVRSSRKQREPSMVQLDLTERQRVENQKALHHQYASMPEDVPIVLENWGHQWEIPYKELTIRKEVGRGAFGIVYLALFKGKQVAVKQMATTEFSSKELDGFIGEIDLMKALTPHDNVVTLVGMCKDPICMITQYYDRGSLFDYLMSVRRNVDLPKGLITKILVGIAEGMNHLHSEKIIHRDLATRNILLASDFSPKIGDFGLSRLSQNNYHKTTTNVGPLKWFAPECIIDLKYSTKSDVWSYGVVIFEVIVREEPYKELQVVQAATKVAYEGLRLSLPAEKLPRYRFFADLMASCLETEPESRPFFSEISILLKQQSS